MRRHIPAWWWVSFFKGFLLLCSCQDESWKYLFYILSFHLFVLFVSTLWSAISVPPPHTPFPFAQYLLALFAELLVNLILLLQSPCSHFLTCCLIDRVLVCTHWAFDCSPPPPPPSVHTHKYIQYAISVWLGQVLKLFFSLTAVISVSWQRLQKGVDKEASFSMTVFFNLLLCPDTHPANTKWKWIKKSWDQI